MLEQAAANTGRTDIKDADIIICDVKVQESLEAMAAKARVVLNCVGPYRFTGEQVSQSIFHLPTEPRNHPSRLLQVLQGSASLYFALSIALSKKAY